MLTASRLFHSSEEGGSMITNQTTPNSQPLSAPDLLERRREALKQADIEEIERLNAELESVSKKHDEF
jgi:hypothetical protein